MGQISDKLKDKVEAHGRGHMSATIGEIRKYDNTTNTASIVFSDPVGGSMMNADRVPLQCMSPGIAGNSPEPGQKCIVSFMSDSLLAPVITSLYGDDYSERIYSRMSDADSGGYLCSPKALSVDMDKETAPLTESYFNDVPAYAYSEYKDMDTEEEALKKMAGLDKYKSGERGFSGLENGASIKEYSDGSVGIFASGGSGIRVLPGCRGIEIYGDIKIMKGGN